MIPKKLKYTIFYISLGLTAVLCSCAWNKRIAPSVPTPTETGDSQSTLTMGRVIAITSSPSIYPIPTFTLPASASITSSLIPTQTIGSSVTPLPTIFTEDELKRYITNLSQNPGNCKLPCWWGLIPGVSSWQEVKDFMFHIGYGDFIPNNGHDLSESLIFDSGLIYQYLMMDQKADLLSQIWFSSQTDYEPTQFGFIWNLYSPRKILAQYGKPSRILLFISLVNDQNPTNKLHEGYGMYLFYDQSGFVIQYTGRGTIKSDKVRICPALGGEDITLIKFFLQDPMSPLPLENMIDGFQDLTPDILPLDQATGLTIDQFMGFGRGDFNCFDTPMSIWP